MGLARSLPLLLSLSMLCPVGMAQAAPLADESARSASASPKPLASQMSEAITGRVAEVAPQQSPADDPALNLDEPRATAALHSLPRSAKSNDSPRDDLGELLEGDSWTRFYNAGLHALEYRMYDEAEEKLIQAIKQAKRGISHDQQLVDARNALADVYLGQDQFHEAEKLYDLALASAHRSIGPESLATAHAENGLAECVLVKGNFARAYELCKHAIAVRRKQLGANHHDLGQSFITMGTVLSKEGWVDQAQRFYEHGLKILEQSPGTNEMDLADALRRTALFEQSRARRADAQVLFEKAYAIMDKCVKYDQNSHLKGVVRFRWEEGSPRSQEIPDQDFPLRYMVSNNVRVAATVVDLWELIGVLISVTNVGDQRTEVGIGKVNLLRTSLDPFDPSTQKLEFIEPHSVDHVRREKQIWDLTQSRPWFANIQKTRNVRGLVPSRGHDLFRGPNVFGIYGEWQAANRVLPEKFQLEPSPERVQYQAEVVVDPSLVRTNNIKVLGLTPISLEPFESRTGYLLYLNPRCERLMLRVTTGNATFEIPFRARKKRITNS